MGAEGPPPPLSSSQASGECPVPGGIALCPTGGPPLLSFQALHAQKLEHSFFMASTSVQNWEKGKESAVTGKCKGTWTVVETMQCFPCLELVGKEVREEDNSWDQCKVPYGPL